jgi:hypothetical protein
MMKPARISLCGRDVPGWWARGGGGRRRLCVGGRWISLWKGREESGAKLRETVSRHWSIREQRVELQDTMGRERRGRGRGRVTDTEESGGRAQSLLCLRTVPAPTPPSVIL